MFNYSAADDRHTSASYDRHPSGASYLHPLHSYTGMASSSRKKKRATICHPNIECAYLLMYVDIIDVADGC